MKALDALCYALFGSIGVYSIIAGLCHLVLGSGYHAYFLLFGPYGIGLTPISGIIIGAYLLILTGEWKWYAFPLFILACAAFDLSLNPSGVINTNQPMLVAQFYLFILAYLMAMPTFKFHPRLTVLFVIFWLVMRGLQGYPELYVYEVGLFAYLWVCTIGVAPLWRHKYPKESGTVSNP